MSLRSLLAVLSFSFVYLCVLCGEQLAQQPAQRPPDYENKMKQLESFEAGVQPLIVLGDLNEDGMVDAADLQLLQQAAGGDTNVGCLAAADLDHNGAVDAKDAALLQGWLKDGPIDAPALAYPSRLPCRFRNFFIAAASHVRPGGRLPIHFLDPRFTIQNSRVTVLQGQASIIASNNEFLAQVPPSAALDSQVTLRISLADGRQYLYTFSVVGPPK